MDLKRGLILLLAITLVIINFFNFLTMTTITGKATESTIGNATICIGRAPAISSISSQTATVGSLFTYQVEATFYGANTSINYYDNTSLFTINQSGYINFTPTSADVGTHSIAITIEHVSECITLNSVQTFTLTISAAPAEETPAAAGGGGGGGGGGGVAKAVTALPEEEELILRPSFIISDKTVKVTVKQSQKAEKRISIINDGNVGLSITIDNPITEVEVEPEQFTITPGEEKIITLTFNPQQKAVPNIYSGIITLHGEYEEQSITKKMTVVLEVESEKVLFDGSIDLNKKSLTPGEEIQFTISVSGLIPGSATLIYSISDLQGNVRYTEEEAVSLQEQVSFSKTLPLQLEQGQYLLSLKILSQDSFATTTELFYIEAPPSALAGLAIPFLQKPFFLFSIPIVLVVLALLLVIVYILHRRTRQLPAIISKAKVSFPSQPKAQPVAVDTSTLQRKLSLLKEGHQRGYIKEDTYVKAKTYLEGEIARRKG